MTLNQVIRLYPKILNKLPFLLFLHPQANSLDLPSQGGCGGVYNQDLKYGNVRKQYTQLEQED